MSILYPNWLCRFIRRHKNKFVFAGVFVGSVYGVIKFAEYKIRNHLKDEQKRVADEMKYQRNFELVQEHSVSISEAMLENIYQKVKEVANTEEITEKLKSGSGDKMLLWNELKITVFCRIATGMFAVTLVSLVHRVQMNQIAGLMFHSRDLDDSIDPRQQRFFSVTHDHLMNHGIHDLAVYIKELVKDIVGTMPLQCLVKPSGIENTIESIYSRLTLNTHDPTGIVGGFKVVNVVFPEITSFDDWAIVQPTILDDIESWSTRTVDVLDSPDFKEVLLQCVKRGVKILGQELNSAVNQIAATKDEVDLTDFNEVSLPLAKLLPLINGTLTSICSSAFLHDFSSIPIINKFSLNVYESFLCD
ncbi:peroxisomal biogenesis factor 3-like [Clavelina lepadiformis]|uniref:peroxisomal biogenesis factor 3-like n=1 Tax=Clavelina lepadiformis TaxID=159417 RepID=UPI004040FFDB